MNTSKYLNTYLWQGVSIFSRFASVFAIVPLLSRDTTVYGIYALCVSLSIYLSYADLGFLGAAQKYAAECVARKDLRSEMRYVGFSMFILMVVGGLFSCALLYLSINPQHLIREGSTAHLGMASWMLAILALSVPVTILQRTILTAFEIRLETYISNKIVTATNFLTIVGGIGILKRSYDVVAYFAYSQALILAATIVCYLVARARYGYGFLDLVGHVRFDKSVYAEIKGLSYTGLYLMLFWIVFYEVDQIVIMKLLGASSVGLYAIAAAVSGYLRVAFGAAYAPFLARANQYVGLNDDTGLREMMNRVMLLFTPIVVFICLIVGAFSGSFVRTWVGPEYDSSAYLVSLIALQFSFSVLSYPVGAILVAKLETRKLRFVSLLQPISYWLLVAVFLRSREIDIFVEARVVVLAMTFAYYSFILSRFFGISPLEMSKKYFAPLVVAVASLAASAMLLSPLLPSERSKAGLLILMGTGLLLLAAALSLQYGVSASFRNVIKDLLSSRAPRKAIHEA